MHIDEHQYKIQCKCAEVSRLLNYISSATLIEDDEHIVFIYAFVDTHL